MKKSLLLFSFLTFNVLCFAQDPIVALTESNSTVTCDITADFTYSSPEYCKYSLPNPEPILLSSAVLGTFNYVADPALAVLLIDSASGVIDLAGSDAGDYIITNTIAAANGCPEVNFSSNITINNQPVADFIYAQTNYCRDGVNPSPNLLGDAGIFTSLPGLDLNPITGEINLANSTSGTYTVSNEIPAAGGCFGVVVIFFITITEPAAGSFSYNTPLYISTLVPQIPTAAVTAGGVYSSAPGLVIDATTGAIDSSASSAGIYTVNYDIPANAGCSAFNAAFDVTILLSLNTNHFSDFSVQLFPNPANSKLYIKTSNDIILDKIIITDLLGKIVAKQTINTSEINVEELAAGLYLIKGFYGNQKFQSKFIKK